VRDAFEFRFSFSSPLPNPRYVSDIDEKDSLIQILDPNRSRRRVI